VRKDDDTELAHVAGVCAVLHTQRHANECAESDKMSAELAHVAGVCAVHDTQRNPNATECAESDKMSAELAPSLGVCAMHDTQRDGTERAQPDTVSTVHDLKLDMDANRGDDSLGRSSSVVGLSESRRRERDKLLSMQREMQRLLGLDQPGKRDTNDGASVSESGHTAVSRHASGLIPVAIGDVDAQHVRVDYDQRLGIPPPRGDDSEYVQNVTSGVSAADLRACESERDALQRKLEQVQSDMHALTISMRLHETKNSALEEDLRTCVTQRDSLQGKVRMYEAERDALQASLQIAVEELALVHNELRRSLTESRHDPRARELEKGTVVLVWVQMVCVYNVLMCSHMEC
jgi:hypothetical protein